MGRAGTGANDRSNSIRVSSQDMGQLPDEEVKAWDQARTRDDDDANGRREVTRRIAGVTSTAMATQEEFILEVDGRLARWRRGEYQICEVAQLLADVDASLPPAEFCKQMEDAAHVGALITRRNGVVLRPDQLEQGRIFTTIVHQADVNHWLEDLRPTRELVFPYEFAAKKPRAAAATTQDWKEKASARAKEILAEYKAKDWHPNQNTIADQIAKEFREQSPQVVGSSGKPLAGATIKRWAFKGITQ